MANVSVFDSRVPEDNYDCIDKRSGATLTAKTHGFLGDWTYGNDWKRGTVVLPPVMKLSISGAPGLTLTCCKWSKDINYHGGPGNDGVSSKYIWPVEAGRIYESSAQYFSYTNTTLAKAWLSSLKNLSGSNGVQIFTPVLGNIGTYDPPSNWSRPSALGDAAWDVWLDVGDYSGGAYGTGAETDIRFYLQVSGLFEIDIPLRSTTYSGPLGTTRYRYFATESQIGLNLDSIFQSLDGQSVTGRKVVFPPDNGQTSGVYNFDTNRDANSDYNTATRNNVRAAIYNLRSGPGRENRMSSGKPPQYELNSLTISAIETKPTATPGTPSTVTLNEPSVLGAEKTEVEFSVMTSGPAASAVNVRLNMSPSLPGQFVSVAPPNQEISAGQRGPVKFKLQTKIDADALDHQTSVSFSDANGNVTSSSSVTVKILDADVPRIVIDKTLIVLTIPAEDEALGAEEWVRGDYTIRLNLDPGAGVSVRVNITPSQVTPHPGIWADRDHVILNSANYAAGVTVTVYTDNRDRALNEITLAHESVSTSSKWNDLEGRSILVRERINLTLVPGGTDTNQETIEPYSGYQGGRWADPELWPPIRLHGKFFIERMELDLVKATRKLKLRQTIWETPPWEIERLDVAAATDTGGNDIAGSLELKWYPIVPILYYDLRRRPPAGGVWQTEEKVTGTSAFVGETYVPAHTTKILTGLTSGDELEFSVRGRNAAGWGPWSAPVKATVP